MTNGQADDLEDWYAAEESAARRSVTPPTALTKLGFVIGLVTLGVLAYFIAHRRLAR